MKAEDQRLVIDRWLKDAGGQAVGKRKRVGMTRNQVAIKLAAMGVGFEVSGGDPG